MSNKETTTQNAPYRGDLTPLTAATAMQAARLNALDLLDTAEILFSFKRFAHSIAFSILSIEEAGKLSMLLLIFLGLGGKRSELWSGYRNHRAKTQTLGVGIEARIRAEFPDLTLSKARELRKRGPTPDELEISKQRAVYSDCIGTAEGLQCHLPRNLDWRHSAWQRLCEARAIVEALRDRSPAELEMWLKHAQEAQASGSDLPTMLRSLHKELLTEGYVKDGWWDILLADIERDFASGDKPT